VACKYLCLNNCLVLVLTLSSSLVKKKNATTSEYYIAKRRNQLEKYFKKWNCAVSYY